MRVVSVAPMQLVSGTSPCAGWACADLTNVLADAHSFVIGSRKMTHVLPYEIERNCVNSNRSYVRHVAWHLLVLIA